jgi:hypothetical protein
MSVFTITINDQIGSFPKRSSEVAFIVQMLNLAAARLQSQQGDASSGNLIGQSPSGVANSVLGSWTYAASGTQP